ncbi:hypothetical protein HY993_04255 [Candidatus Micrarchaeota archaeon]|nr:hypothetical protein [Candidatus Micrarchaeota archaeon]
MGKAKHSVRPGALRGIPRPRARGQLSVEFFLIAAFLVALAIALIATSSAKVDDLSSLSKALQAKTTLDTLSTKANSAYVQGDGSQYSFDAFLPSGPVCLLYNSSTQRLFCDFGGALGNNKPVSGPALYASITFSSPDCQPSSSSQAGWFNFVVRNNAGSIVASCTKLT